MFSIAGMKFAPTSSVLRFFYNRVRTTAKQLTKKAYIVLKPLQTFDSVVAEIELFQTD